MSTTRVLLAEPTRQSELDMWQQRLGSVGCTVLAPNSMDDSELIDSISDVEALLVRRRPISRRLIDQGLKLQLIQKIGQRVDNIDLDAARHRGIAVKTSLNPSWLGVAEHTVAMVLAISKQLRPADTAVRTGVNPDQIPSQTTTETSYAYNWSQMPPPTLVHGKSVGLVGFGEIGQLVAARVQALGMNVLYTRKRGPEPAADALGYSWRILDALLRESDFLSIHVPLNDETSCLIGARELGLMKQSAFLVNTSRGGVVDQDALVDALSAGAISGAALDVFREEPLLADDPLTRLDNVILSPHIAAVRPEFIDAPFSDIVGNIGELAKVVSS